MTLGNIQLMETGEYSIDVDSLSELFLRKEEGWRGQTFVHRDDLKRDLTKIADEWEGLNEEEREKRMDGYGLIPPEDSITHRLWQKHMRPRKPGEGNLLKKMSREEQDKLVKQFEPILEAIKEMEEQRQGKS